MQSVAPIVSTLFLICLAAPIGIYPIRKYIQIQEAKHELKHGSAGFIRSFGGWIIIAIWVAVVWFIATILGDWWASGDINGAIERSGRRLEVLFRIISAMSDD